MQEMIRINRVHLKLWILDYMNKKVSILLVWIVSQIETLCLIVKSLLLASCWHLASDFERKIWKLDKTNWAVRESTCGKKWETNSFFFSENLGKSSGHNLIPFSKCIFQTFAKPWSNWNHLNCKDYIYIFSCSKDMPSIFAVILRFHDGHIGISINNDVEFWTWIGALISQWSSEYDFLSGNSFWIGKF